VQRGGAPRPDPLFGRSRPSWESVGRALWKRIRVEALCGRSRPHLGARSETRCGSAPRVEALLGRPAPTLEGLDRKDRGERHPPGPAFRTVEALLGIGWKDIVEAHLAWKLCSEGQLPLWRDLIGRIAAKGTRPEPLHTGSRPIASRPLCPRESHVDGNVVVSHGSACSQMVRGSSTSWRTLVEGGDRMPSPPACRRRRADERRGATIPGQPGFRRTRCVVQLSAFPTLQRVALAGVVVATSPVPTSCG
jgi:hypothetical protein